MIKAHPWRVTATVAVVLLLLLSAGLWLYSDRLHSGAFAREESPDPPNVLVVDVSDGTITLRPTRDTETGDLGREGLFGLQWPGGYARFGAILGLQGDTVVRELFVLGQSPLAGQTARTDSFVFRGDPLSAHGIAYEDVQIPGPLGDFPAWFLPASGPVWAIFVHGKGSTREEALRMIPVIHELELPVLDISYRNDPEYPPAGNSRYAYGESEWQDVAAAIDYALRQGAQRFVLIGFSMGGGIVMATLERPQYASLVQGVILDAPMLDLARSVDFRAAQSGIPGLVTDVVLQLARLRFGIDWDRVDYLSRVQNLSVPILLFHGDDDPTVPVATSDSLAELRPDLVTYHRVSGAGHVRSWNVDPDFYADVVRAFIVKVIQE